jgi:iron complex transport system substrate-binding protein
VIASVPYTDIATISACVDAAAAGAKVIADMHAEIEQTRSKAAHLPRRRVFLEEWGKPIITSQPWVSELVEAARGEFLGKPGAKISREEVSRMDPEVIIAAWCGAADRVPLEKIVRKRGWSGTTAARDLQVYCISDELLNTPAPTLLGGLRALAGAIHPETFANERAPKGLRRITEVPDFRTAPRQFG